MNADGGDDDDWETDPDFVVSECEADFLTCMHASWSRFQLISLQFQFMVL